jgi:molybdate transport system substrate-binding protein
MLKRALFFGSAIVLALTLGPSVSPLEANPREISVAAAADLSVVLPEIAQAFEKASGVGVKLSFAASGALTQQIENGAPFDVFLSADMGYPQHLVSEGKADEATLHPYAVGGLVLWTQADSPLDLASKGMQIVLDPSVRKIAIANPQHAPYGRTAVAALKYYGLYEKISDRLVLGENIAQAAQFVESGNAQVGLVALAHALAPAMKGKGKYWKVPAGAYPALDQGAVVIANSEHRQDALAFLEYLKSAEARAVLQHYGFTSPDEKQDEK